MTATRNVTPGAARTTLIERDTRLAELLCFSPRGTNRSAIVAALSDKREHASAAFPVFTRHCPDAAVCWFTGSSPIAWKSAAVSLMRWLAARTAPICAFR